MLLFPPVFFGIGQGVFFFLTQYIDVELNYGRPPRFGLVFAKE